MARVARLLMGFADKEPAPEVPELKSILFATDFSPASTAATPYVAAVARQYQAKVYLAHVIAPKPHPAGAPDPAAGTLEQADRDAWQGLAELSKQFEGVLHEPLLGHGEVAATLGGMIRKHAIDLGVVGTHGRRGFRRFLLGSVAEEIFRTLPRPVLTVGPRVSTQARQEPVFRHVLYPTNLLEKPSDAARYAVSLASQYAARLTVLYVLEVLPEASTTDWQAKLVVREFQEQMERLIPAAAKARFNAEYKVEFGEPVATILRVAQEGSADLIVLSVRKADLLASHLSENIAYRIATNAECPVLTVPAGS